MTLFSQPIRQRILVNLFKKPVSEVAMDVESGLAYPPGEFLAKKFGVPSHCLFGAFGVFGGFSSSFEFVRLERAYPLIGSMMASRLSSSQNTMNSSRSTAICTSAGMSTVMLTANIGVPVWAAA